MNQLLPANTAKPRAALSSTGAKVAASLGGQDTLTAAPPSAFGFLPAKAAATLAPPMASVSGSVAPATSVRAPALPSAPGVALNGSLGQTQQPVIKPGPNGLIDPAIYGTMGRQMGSNLFFSFSSFNLTSSEAATFSGPFSLSIPVRNIFALVTGGSSSIDGLISTTAIPGANFFLINPAGVLFGPNAKLEISGSFVVSTADYVKFADGTQVNASEALNGTLSSAAVSAFGFLSAKPAAVTFTGSQLSVPIGTGLHVIAGDITLNGTSLEAPSGFLTVFSAASPGEVPFSLASPGSGYSTASFSALGSISLTNNSLLAIDGAGGGQVVIRGGSMMVDNSTISSVNSGSTPGGNMNLQIDGALSLVDGGSVLSASASSGQSGNLWIHARSLTIDGAANPSQFTGIEVESEASAIGNAGNLHVLVNQLLSITGGGKISSSAFGLGTAGNLTVSAANITVSGATPNNSSYSAIATESFSQAQGGKAGNVTVTATGKLDIEAGGQISSQTNGLGNTGKLTVSANDITISGAASGNSSYSAIFALSRSTAQGGASGEVTVTATGQLDIEAGAQISSATNGLGNAGKVTVSASNITISGATSNNSSDSAIFANSNSSTQGGAAGNVIVTANGQLLVKGGGEISSVTSGLGNAGDVHVSAANITISGATSNRSYLSGILGNSYSPTQGGSAGNVTVTASGQLLVKGGGEISSATSGLGNAGDVTVRAANITISGATSHNPSESEIFADSDSATQGGSAGRLTVTASGQLLIIGGGEISSTTFGLGNAGDITVSATNIIISGATSHNSSLSEIVADSDSATAGGVAGNVVVTTSGQLLVRGGGEISSETFGLGNAGAVTVSAANITISGATPGNSYLSEIVADSNSAMQGGAAGNMVVTASGQLLVKGGGEISSETDGFGNAGNVAVSAANITISGATSDNSSFSGIFAESNSGKQGGDAGNVIVTASSQLFVKEGGGISSATHGLGNAGDVAVSAGNITVSGTSPDSSNPSEIYAYSRSGKQGGDAGNVTVTASGQLLVKRRGAISSDTFGSGNGGNVTVNAGSLTIDGSAKPNRFTGISVEADPGSTGNAGNLQVTVDQLLSITGSGEISAGTFASGNGGNLTVQAGSLTIDGTATPGQFTGIEAEANPRSSGNAGNLQVTVDQLLSITGGGQILADTFGSGNGGNLTVHAGSLTINGSATPSQLTLISDTAERGSSGNAGDLQVTVDQLLSITGGGQILAITFASGNGGNLTVQAGSLNIDGSATPGLFTGISVDANAGSRGNAGNLQVTVNQLLSITGSGEISADTFASGNGGNLTVHAGSLNVDGSATPSLFTGISAEADAGSSGNAGGILVAVGGNLALVGGAGISSSTSGLGTGGRIQVSAQDIVISGEGGAPSGIAADTHGTGNAGDVVVNASGNLEINDAGYIAARTFGLGNGGDATVAADELTIGNGGVVSAESSTSAPAGSVRLTVSALTLDSGASVLSANTGSGNAGSVLISSAGSVTLDGASTISTAAASGSAGMITIDTGANLSLSGDSRITASAGKGGGDVTLRVGGTFYLWDSSVTATAGFGAGGNITIDPAFIILDHGLISANAAAGAGGNILIEGEYFFSNESSITATGTTEGTVQIATLPLDLVNALAGLQAGFVDLSAAFQERCPMRLGSDYSSFLVIGRGGVEDSPDEPQEQMPPRHWRKPKSEFHPR